MVYEYRRPTQTWIRVNVRHCRELGLPIKVVREGEPRRGAVVLNLKRPKMGCRVLTQTRNAEGRTCWLSVFGDRLVPEPEAESYLRRAHERDPDVWIVEVETPDGENPFRGEIV